MIYMCMYVYIGNKNCRIFVLGGDALEDANGGQSLAQSGKVVVSSQVWEVCSRDKFFANVLEGGKFVEVVQVSMCLHSFVHFHKKLL